MVALAALVFAPAAFAQDDNPSADDLGGDDRGGERGFDDNPTGDDVMASPAASATATPTAAAVGDDATASVGRRLPSTGGSPLSVAAGVLLVGSGIMAAMLMRRTS